MRSKSMNLWIAVIPIVTLLVVIGLDSLRWNIGDVRIALLAGTIVAVGIGIYYRYEWTEFEEAFAKKFMLLGPAIIFIIVIGGLIGAGTISGGIPTVAYYGMAIVRPEFLVVTAYIICAILGTGLGSSWTTVATIGVAFVVIGYALDFDELQIGVLVGAIISGAYFGDKISPLSDTSALAATAADVPYWEHIKYNAIYTLWSGAIALVLFIFMTFVTFERGVDVGPIIEDMRSSIDQNFNVSPIALTPLLVLVPIMYFKIQPIPALSGMMTLMILVAVNLQGFSFGQALDAMLNGYEFGNESIYPVESTKALALLISNTTGVAGQLWTISIVVFALMFIASLETIGSIEIIGHAVRDAAKTDGQRIAGVTILSALFAIVSADQYVGLTAPASIMSAEFDRENISALNLSRASEDGGTVAGVLFPWTTCGALVSSTYGVSAGQYFLFTFFPLASIGVGIIFPILGIGIVKEDFKRLIIQSFFIYLYWWWNV